jgi:hypothetical protein
MKPTKFTNEAELPALFDHAVRAIGFYEAQRKEALMAALSHQPFLLLTTCLTARLGFNKFNGLARRQGAATEPLLARCDNAGRRCAGVSP